MKPIDLDINFKKEKSYILFVLDESGSMSSIYKQTLSGLNEQIQTIKKTNDNNKIEVIVDFIKFSTTPMWLFNNKNVNELKEFTEEDYNPSGYTAMRDAIGEGIKHLESYSDINDKTTSVLVIIISDGEENNSIFYSDTDIAEMIQDKQSTNRWTFTYMGANQDLSKIQKTFNIPKKNIVTWKNTIEGTTNAHEGLSSSVENYVSHRATTYGTGTHAILNFYDIDRKKK